MRAILDTNVWLDWLVFGDARVAPLAAAIEAGAVRVQATGPMLDELAAVLVRPHFGLDAAAREAACARQRALVTLHAPAPDCRLPCTDPDDRMFVDLAVALRVDWLVSRDKALLRLRRIAGRRFALRIGTPEDWRAAAAASPAAPRL
jgi:predicted nucleic acid-binding protein